ncbi:Aminoacylase-1 [Sesamum angolense]|uniref:Aminoacylase-1 n=1 Tax=Sesamum angolense TaxID=2727404 RepID=A0AAE2C1C2_9LAMI|nr:Aminoacylase-1 [Sesamum angolense]
MLLDLVTSAGDVGQPGYRPQILAEDVASLERRIAEEWAPATRNMTFEFKQRVSTYDKFGKPILTAFDSSNPWWALLEDAIKNVSGKLGKPEIFPASTDARYFRELGLPAIGFSPMANTPILLHDHNEVNIFALSALWLLQLVLGTHNDCFIE